MFFILLFCLVICVAGMMREVVLWDPGALWRNAPTADIRVEHRPQLTSCVPYIDNPGLMVPPGPQGGLPGLLRLHATVVAVLRSESCVSVSCDTMLLWLVTCCVEGPLCCMLVPNAMACAAQVLQPQCCCVLVRWFCTWCMKSLLGEPSFMSCVCSVISLQARAAAHTVFHACMFMCIQVPDGSKC